jgi:hypothetical protein
MDRYSADITAPHLNLAGVESGPKPQAYWLCRRCERHRTSDCTARSIKGRQNAVASRFDENTAMLFHDPFRQLVVLIQQATPAQIALLGGAAGRVHDIREENRGKNSLDIARRALAMSSDEFLDVAEQYLACGF